MKLYLNELAPWERKKEYFHTIQLGKDVTHQTEVLRDAIKNQTKAQLISASAIVASQERIQQGIDELAEITSEGFDRVSDGLSSLQSSFEIGISEVVWQIEKNREELKSILEVLQAPLDTQAKERRKRAETAFENGWIDDAEEEFIESEKLNKYDFTIHISLGMIYLFHKINKDKSLEYFEKAIKYARPKSNYYTSYGLLYKSILKKDFGLIEEAEKILSDAVTLSPDFAEAKYQCAILCVHLNKDEKCIELLRDAINIDPKYCLKINSEIEFDKIRDKIDSLLEDVRGKWKNQAVSERDKIETKIIKFDEITTIITRLESKFDKSHQVDMLQKWLKNIDKLFSNNSIFDFILSIKKLKKIEEQIVNLYLRAKDDYALELNKMKDQLRIINNSISTVKDRMSDCTQWIGILLFGQIIALIAAFIGGVNGFIISEIILIYMAIHFTFIKPKERSELNDLRYKKNNLDKTVSDLDNAIHQYCTKGTFIVDRAT